MKIHYAGIGSRKTPPNVFKIMTQLGEVFAKKGFVLRSGAAEGADTAFESGCDNASGEKQIFLPWKGFNDSTSDLYFENLPILAQDIAFEHHPNLYKSTYGVIKMMARNSCQVLGQDCQTPSHFVVCYCEIDKAGNPVGGTGQAIRVANAYNVPVFNLFFQDDLHKLKEFVKQLEEQMQTQTE